MTQPHTYDEWRVTGKPGHGFPDYDFVWTPDLFHIEPEAAARKFIRLITETGGQWEDGPHLSKRTVTRTPWQPADDESPGSRE